MKIKKLTIQNINSIYGKWEINFEDAEYRNNPLFAIIGQTGSGKTTILDAISFALYDQTDRMGGERSAIASRGTTECMAELVFEVNGIEYIAYSAMKAGVRGANRGKYGDGLDSSWIQWNENGDRKLEGTRAKTAKVIELLGLDFNKFRQVILLAQGKFNAFLQADTGERSAILENITGTQIYSRIGKRIHDMNHAFGEQLKRMNARKEGISVLSEEEVQAKNSLLKEIEAEEEKNSGRLKDVDSLLKVEEAKGKCEEKLKVKEKDNENLKAEEESFAKELPRLEAARVAERIVPAFDEHKKHADEQERDKVSLQEREKELPGLQGKAEETAKESQKAEECLRQAQKAQETREVILKEVDALDSDIVRAKKDYDVSNRECGTISTQIKEGETKSAELEKALKELEKSKSSADSYLQDNSQDKELESKNAEWKVVCSSLKKDKNELSSFQEQTRNTAKAYADAEKAAEDESKTVEKAQADVNEKEAVLKNAKEELKLSLGGETLETLKDGCEEQQKVVTMLQAVKPQELLATFHDGEPCPVCGSTHHPYRGLPAEEMPDLKKAQERLEALKGRYDKAEKASKSVDKATQSVDKAQLELRGKLDSLELKRKVSAEKRKNLEDIRKTLSEKQSNYDDSIANLRKELEHFGLELDESLALPKEIQSRIDGYKAKVELVEGFEREKAKHLQRKAAIDGELAVKRQSLSNEQAKREGLKKELDEKAKSRGEKYGEGKTADERTRLRKAVDDASNAKTQAAERAASASANLENAKSECARLRIAMDTRKGVLDERKELLDKALTDNGMTLETFLASRLPQNEFESLATRETSLKTRREALDNEKKRLDTEFETYKGQLPEAFDAQAVRAEKGELEEKVKQLAEQRGGIRQELSVNEDNQKKMGELLKEIADAEKNMPLWDKLDSWVGGSNGMAFKMMAQKYTFDNLLVKANEQLGNMLGGRYQMCSHQASEELEIDVIDNQLGGDLRTSKNLSGGEQFVISMALALGLASMVGEKFNVDSLFLDEGFGTLDGNELEEAMNTLSQLKGKGKLVGIITHAERLQERISTRIVLRKGGNGRSTIEGPGVTKGEPPKFFLSDEEKKRLEQLEKEEKAHRKAAQKAGKAESLRNDAAPCGSTE